MNLPTRIHAHLERTAADGAIPFELEELAFVFAGDDVDDIRRALGQLVREGKAVEVDGPAWHWGKIKQRQQQELFA